MSAPQRRDRRRVLVIFAKWPRTGHVKRRLTREVGRAGSSVLARAFLADTLALAARTRPDELIVAYAPPSARAQFAAQARGATLVPQPRASFGDRLRAALAAGVRRGDEVVLIGSDSPTLAPVTVGAAFARLENGAECVVGPSEDGGYYLIGCRRRVPGTLFDAIPWSTNRVFAATAARASAAGIRLDVLRPWYDVDDSTGLERLRADRAGLRRASATREALRRMAGEG